MRKLIFGSFDCLHLGHLALLNEISAWVNTDPMATSINSDQDELIVILARDEVILGLKGVDPTERWIQRADALLATGLVSEVWPSDPLGFHGKFLATQKANPDLIGFGYDQKELQQAWLEFKLTLESTLAGDNYLPTMVCSPYRERIYKSSLLRH